MIRKRRNPSGKSNENLKHLTLFFVFTRNSIGPKRISRVERVRQLRKVCHRIQRWKKVRKGGISITIR